MDGCERGKYGFHLCAVLRCAVLYCTVLYCTALYCTVQYCTDVVCYTMLSCTALCVVHHTVNCLKLKTKKKFKGVSFFNHIL